MQRKLFSSANVGESDIAAAEREEETRYKCFIGFSFMQVSIDRTLREKKNRTITVGLCRQNRPRSSVDLSLSKAKKNRCIA